MRTASFILKKSVYKLNNWLSKLSTRDQFRELDPKTDPDLLIWQKISSNVQRQAYAGLVGKVQDWGHKTIEKISQVKDGMTIEIGCGIGHHFNFLNFAQQKKYMGLDINFNHLKAAKTNFNNFNIIQGNAYNLPLSDKSIDKINAIYIFEHLHKLQDCLQEICRVIKDGGELLGVVPTEGGLAWHLGRSVTTKRFLEKKYNINYNKVVYYEHCNTCREVLKEVDQLFHITHKIYMPFHISSIHLNAVVVFRAIKQK